MKFLTPMELRSVNFKKINQLYESKEIGFVGFNFDTFHTVWLPIQYEIGQKQIRMLDDGEITIEAKLVMALCALRKMRREMLQANRVLLFA